MRNTETLNKMGCWCSSEKEEGEMSGIDAPKVYSWDRKEDIDMSKYMVDGLEGKVVVKRSGDIDGQQFLIQNCQDCIIILLDHMDTVTVDKCSNCKIVIGPVQGSIFIRDCDGCACAVSCQQFRTRDCENLNVHLLCTTQPVIESSRSMRFYPLHMRYDDLLQHYEKANLSFFDNHWDNIHDFTPGEYESNWQIASHGEDGHQLILTTGIIPSSYDELQQGGEKVQVKQDEQAQHSTQVQDEIREAMSSSNLSFTSEDSLIPAVMGASKRHPRHNCVIIFFHHPSLTSQVMLKVLHDLSSRLSLIKTRKMNVSKQEAMRLFIDESPQSIAYREAALRGSLVSAEYGGENAIEICQEVTKQHVSSNKDERLVYCTPNHEDTSHMLNLFNTLYDTRFNF